MSNRITKVAIVGAGGHCGTHVTNALLATGKHAVTAITRIGSQSKLPDGVQVVRVDYDHKPSLVDALRGHDALVIFLNNTSPIATQNMLAHAAAEAGVPWVLPNEWGVNPDQPAVIKDIPSFGSKREGRDYIASLGTVSYLAVTCGFWYEWSLSSPERYGFDFEKRAVTFYDDGATRTSTSTWPQVGRAVAALLSLPIEAEHGDNQHSLANFRNQQVFVSSFTLTQKDMFASVLRVTGTQADEWTVSYEKSADRVRDGIQELKAGSHLGFPKMLYARMLYPDGCGLLESQQELSNEILGLPKEDLDPATAAGIARSVAELKSDH